MDLIKTAPQKERAQSMLKMTLLIEKRINLQDRKTMCALIIADYYEIIKELLTAFMLIEGYKVLNHKDLIEYSAENYRILTKNEISSIDTLRILRNRISYEGYNTDPSYLTRNETRFKGIITKLRAKILKNAVARI